MERRASDNEMTCRISPTQQSSQLTEHVTVRIKQEVAEDRCDRKSEFFSEMKDDCKNFDLLLVKVERNDAQECSTGLNNGLQLPLNKDDQTEPSTSVITKVKEEVKCKEEVDDNVPYQFNPGLDKRVVYDESAEFFKHAEHGASDVEDAGKLQACQGVKSENNTDLHAQAGNEHGSQVEVFLCTRCNYSVTEKDRLAKHLKRCGVGTVGKRSKTKRKKNPLYQCATCSYTTKVKYRLYRHIKGLHNRHSQCYKCSYCDYTTKRRYNLARHFKFQHDPDVELLKCTFCDYTTKCTLTLSNHVNLNHSSDAPVYRCAECDFTSKSRSYLASHVTTKHKSDAPVYPCPNCSYTTKLKRNLSKHVNALHNADAEVYKCPDCDYASTYKCGLTRHVKVRHDPDVKVYKCTECSYTSKCKSYLTKHVTRKHSSDPPVYQFVECIYTTKGKDNVSLDVDV